MSAGAAVLLFAYFLGCGLAAGTILDQCRRRGVAVIWHALAFTCLLWPGVVLWALFEDRR